MITIGELREHFGFDVIRDKYLDPEEDRKYQERKRKNSNNDTKKEVKKNG